ncbi:MAG: hypothetical protein ABIG95_01195 [Candidatus Woesearchaeota archaeon]
MISHKGSSNVTIKSLFAVFLVIFVLLIAVTSLKTRTTTVLQRQNFDYYSQMNSFLLSYLSNPSCHTIGGYDAGYQIPAQGVLDFYKINKTNNNADLSCAETFQFMYSLQIDDSVNKKQWVMGITKKDYPWVERVISISLPIAILYDRNNIHLGEASLIAYTGEIPLLYGTIKSVCNSQQNTTFALLTEYSVRYDSVKNEFCVASDCFTPYFTCNVLSFTIPKGEHILVIRHSKQTVRVI